MPSFSIDVDVFSAFRCMTVLEMPAAVIRSEELLGEIAFLVLVCFSEVANALVPVNIYYPARKERGKPVPQ